MPRKLGLNRFRRVAQSHIREQGSRVYSYVGVIRAGDRFVLEHEKINLPFMVFAVYGSGLRD